MRSIPIVLKINVPDLVVVVITQFYEYKNHRLVHFTSGFHAVGIISIK